MMKFKKDSLKRKRPPTKSKLVNFRIEEELFEDFRDFCEKKLDNEVSDVLREMMRDLLAQNGYKDYK